MFQDPPDDEVHSDADTDIHADAIDILQIQIPKQQYPWTVILSMNYELTNR